MPISDIQVAALRSLLTRDTENHEQIINRLGDHGIRYGYLELVTIAFIKATQKKFGGKNPSEIVEWVAGVRSERDPQEKVDPNTAEQLILWAFGKANINGMDLSTLEQQSLLLLIIVEDLELDENALESFLQKAREEADEVQRGLNENN